MGAWVRCCSRVRSSVMQPQRKPLQVAHVLYHLLSSFNLIGMFKKIKQFLCDHKDTSVSSMSIGNGLTLTTERCNCGKIIRQYTHDPKSWIPKYAI